MSAQTISKKQLFGEFNLKTISTNPDFKEDSVREVIILPILKQLGYKQKNIVRSKKLKHPYLKIGSKKRKINLFPDYSLKIGNNFAWVLDAKAPNERVKDDDNVEQVYSYATHPEIRSTYFSLCNGKEFSLFKTNSTDEPILYFPIDEIQHYWETLIRYLGPDRFQIGKNFTYDTTNATAIPKETFNYHDRPLLEEIKVQKQKAKRHFGVHGYFTKQSWNVVADYIKNFTKPGDMVLDPFGGSGVTVIEALMNNRKGISIDLNPMPVFIVKSLMAPVNLDELGEAFDRVAEAYKKIRPQKENEIIAALKKYPYPKGNKLPKASDVQTVEQLFSDKQLANLAVLKHVIKKEKNKSIRNSLLVAFSSSVNKYNLTFHYTKSTGGGDGGPFRYYRYRMAPSPGDLSLLDIFTTKYKKVANAKKEMQYHITDKTIGDSQVLKGTARDLSWIPKESVDYIYTDPPYGKKIPYLDLSVMWNAWLDLKVTNKDFQEEAIEGGEAQKSKESYNDLISSSIKEMYRVLKYDRWMSFVFAHKDPEFWHLIIESAENCGFEYIGAVPQKNGQTSFKKRQHPFSVLSGQLIINFRKVKNPRAILKANLGMDIIEIMVQTIEGIIAKNDGATLEQINDELILKGLELGFLDLLKKEYADLTPLLIDNFDYEEETERYKIKVNSKFRTNVDEKLRVRYYLYSFLTRKQKENYNPTFDEIVLYIMPLLKNGITPEKQTILKVLEDIAEHIGQQRWHLKTGGQLALFI